MRAFLLLLTLFVAVCPGQSAEPDAALLTRLSQFREAVRQLGPQLWPGWNPLATPLAIFKDEEMTVLVGHPAPPPGFRRVAAPAIDAPVFVQDSTAGFIHANTAQNFAGALTSFFSWHDFMEKSAGDAMALAVHELFHAHQNRIAPRKYGDISVVLWGQYPEFSARNRALLVLEAGALHGAITARDDAGMRERAAEFMTLRTERRKEMPPDITRYERGEEASEGLARYIELRMLQLMPASEPSPGAAATAAAGRIDALKDIHALPRDRDRFYALGMAQAALLDRLLPDWKKQYETTPLFLDELIARAAPPLPAAAAEALLNKLSFPKVLEEEEKAVEQRRQEGMQRLQRLVSGSGQRVVVEVGALRSNYVLRGFNPNGTVMLGPEQVAHTFLLLDLGKQPGATMRLEFRGVPAVYDRVQEAFWFLLPADSIEKAVAAYAKATGAGIGRLQLKATGFSGDFTDVQVEQRGRELRIRAARDLQQMPELKPPEFVRPDRQP